MSRKGGVSIRYIYITGALVVTPVLILFFSDVLFQDSFKVDDEGILIFKDRKTPKYSVNTTEENSRYRLSELNLKTHDGSSPSKNSASG